MRLVSALMRGKPVQRARGSPIIYALEEMKFLRSLADLRVFIQNIAYLLPRTIGRLDEFRDVPPSLQIEPTNFCNVHCTCCSTARSRRKRGFIDVDLFRKIVDDAAGIGVRRLRLFLHGEPMLHPRIVELIRYAKSARMAVHVTTNGMRLDIVAAEAILRAGVTSADHVTFSILGSSKEVHERIAKGADYDLIRSNVLGLINLRKNLHVNGPVIETIFYTMPENDFEEADFPNAWHGIVDHVRRGGRISESFAQYKKNDIMIRPRTRTCTNLWERMTVFWNGDVTLCDQDIDGDWILGNLRDQSISQIWNCEKLRLIKQAHRDQQFQSLPFCSSCDM